MLNFDLLELPGIRYFTRQWRGVVFANRSARREAKAALFAELAEAAKRGVPLHVALQMICQTAEEMDRARPGKRARGAESRNPLLNGLCAVGLICFLPIGYMIYLILSFRTVDVERIARILAARLLGHVERGHSLAEAMSHCGDYEVPEVAMIRAGVQWGRVPEALRRISEYQTVEARLTAQGAQMLYPLFLMGLLILPITFILVKIIPKFVDIFAQLGMELPGLTLQTIRLSRVLSSFPIILFAVIAGFFLLRALMNGNAVSKLPFLFPAVAALIGGGIGVAVALVRLYHREGLGEEGLFLLGYGVLGILYIGLMPSVMNLLERVVLWAERLMELVVYYIPFLHTPARAEAEARWLSGLALALESGVSGPDAVRSAGDICGGGFRTRSQEAARRMDAGHGLGEACVEEKVLSPILNHRLVLVGLQDDFVGGLRDVADDSSQQAFDLTNRAGRIVEVVAIVAVGIVMAGFILAMYMPLFAIPRAVGQ